MSDEEGEVLTIYGSGFARSRRAMWACEEAGAPYELVELEWPPSSSPEYLKINPAGTVPTLVDGDRVLIESLAICEYVGRRYDRSLVVEPDDPAYWEYLQFSQLGEATLQPPLAWARRYGSYGPNIIPECREAFTMRLSVVERALADGREFLTAGRFTVADLSVGFVLMLSMILKLDDDLPPLTRDYRRRLRARPAYRRAFGLD